jgi:hypothetical protein
MSRRHSWRLVIAILVLSMVDCTPLPERFTRVDGRRPDNRELLIDEAICRDEIKQNLSTANQMTIRGPTEDAVAVYTACTAQKGYKPANE